MQNPPRYSLVDSVKTTQVFNCNTTFGNLQMSYVANVKVKASSILNKPYEEIDIERTTTWYFYKGNKVYVLKSPKGKCYVINMEN